MPNINREQLSAYLDDALSDADTAQLEQALRESEPLRRSLRAMMQERDRGEHSIGAIWRRERLSCATREQLGNFLLGVLENDFQEYIEFHLKTVGCAYCQANLADLQAMQKETAPVAQKRRQKYFESSAGYLHLGRDTR
jgi:hypothetical protein